MLLLLCGDNSWTQPVLLPEATRKAKGSAYPVGNGSSCPAQQSLGIATDSVVGPAPSIPALQSQQLQRPATPHCPFLLSPLPPSGPIPWL